MRDDLLAYVYWIERGDLVGDCQKSHPKLEPRGWVAGMAILNGNKRRLYSVHLGI